MADTGLQYACVYLAAVYSSIDWTHRKYSCIFDAPKALKDKGRQTKASPLEIELQTQMYVGQLVSLSVGQPVCPIQCDIVIHPLLVSHSEERETTKSQKKREGLRLLQSMSFQFPATKKSSSV